MDAETIPEYPEHISDREITITDEARKQLAALYGQIDEDDIEAIRIYVSGGGCGGMSYGMTFTDRRTSFDRVRHEEGFDLYVDAVALQYLQGVEIDYLERPLGSSFVFNNVFATVGGSGTCNACGAAVGAGGGCA